MAQTAIGIMLRRLFVREEPTPPLLGPDPEVEEIRPAARRGPPLIMLVPGVAGVSIYQVRSFDDAHSAAAFIEACNPYRIYKEGIIAFWAMPEKPPHNHDAECAVLVRTEPNSDLVHAYAFADLDAASAYVRFRIEETDEPPESFIVQWAASIRISANPTGEVRLEPSSPPIVPRKMTPPANTGVEQDLQEPPDAAAQPLIEEIEIPREYKATEEPAQTQTLARVASAATPRAKRGNLPEPTKTHWSRKAPRKVSPKVKSHVLALGLMGFSGKDIEAELRTMFPGDRVPARATIMRWLKRAGISRSNLKKWETMSDHAMRVLERRLAELDDASLSEVARVASVLESMRRK